RRLDLRGVAAILVGEHRVHEIDLREPRDARRGRSLAVALGAMTGNAVPYQYGHGRGLRRSARRPHRTGEQHRGAQYRLSHRSPFPGHDIREMPGGFAIRASPFPVSTPLQVPGVRSLRPLVHETLVALDARATFFLRGAVLAAAAAILPSEIH